MHRLLIILYFSIILFDTSCGQNTKVESPNSTFVTKTLGSKENLLKDTVFLNQLAKVYGDSVFIIVDRLLSDKTFVGGLDSTAENYGEFASSVYKIRFPLKSLGWTSDYENIFSSEQIIELDSIINVFEKETTNEIAIVTIDSSWATQENFDCLTLGILRNWRIGKKGKNNGILIGISTGLRIIRIQNGYGIEAKLTDAETKKIIDDIILPEYKNGDFFKGTKKGVQALMQKIR
jgi:uncharacterized protein